MNNLTLEDIKQKKQFRQLTFEQLCVRGALWLEQLQENGVPNEEIVMWLLHLGFDWKREQSTEQIDAIAASVQQARKQSSC